MRLLSLVVHEPLPGAVLPSMAAEVNPEEAARRYRAIALTTLRQLRGLARARIRLLPAQPDAAEAIRFWLLPRLADRWERKDEVYLSPGWELDFGGDIDGFSVRASGDILCPDLGARWVHAAMLGIGQSTSEVIGPAKDGGEYFLATGLETNTGLGTRLLPALPVIRTDEHWREALESAVGTALKKAWEEEG